MRTLSRTIQVAALAVLALCPRLAAQDKSGGENFKWYIGPHGGIIIFETPNQTRGAIPAVGGHILIKARRIGLLVAVDEGFKKNQRTSFVDPTAPNGVRDVRFNNIRVYTAALIAYPFRGHLQPYLGVGLGILQTGSEYPQNTVTAAEKADLTETANQLGSYGFGTALIGLQARAGGVAIFGQAQAMTGPGAPRFVSSVPKLFTGATYSLSAGIRVSLGGSREDVTSGY